MEGKQFLAGEFVSAFPRRRVNVKADTFSAFVIIDGACGRVRRRRGELRTGKVVSHKKETGGDGVWEETHLELCTVNILAKKGAMETKNKSKQNPISQTYKSD